MRFTETVLETYTYGVKGRSKKLIHPSPPTKPSLTKPWLATDKANRWPVVFEQFARSLKLLLRQNLPEANMKEFSE